MAVRPAGDQLNPEQRAAVEHFEGPILVLAGAGSGKTRVLTTRIAHLVNEFGVDPASILAVTFTNKAAGEMRERVRRLLDGEPAGMWVGTFHSIGARLLRRHGNLLGWTSSFSIFDSDQSQREMKRIMERLSLPPKRWHPQAVQGAISSAKNQLVGPVEYALLAGDPFTRVVAQVFTAYQESLREQNAFDFDDLLVRPVELFTDYPQVREAYQRRFQFLLVDEYQDTNRAQYRLLQLLAEHGNMMVVGDDDQSIYGWRGADIRNILDFEKDFPGAVTVRLEQNYRSTGNILDAANQVIAQNINRKGKTLRTSEGPGERITRVEAADERDEAEWITSEIVTRLSAGTAQTPRDFVILYRTNAQSRAHEEALRRRDVPYQIIGGTRFYERREIMDVLAYLRLISNPRDAGAFDRIVNYPRRGIGDTSRARLLAWATEQGLTPLAAALRADECADLRGAATNALRVFAGMIQRYTALAAHLPVGELLEKLLEETSFLEALQEEGPDGDERIENVRELVAGTHDFDARESDDLEPEDAAATATSLDLFLQRVSLISDVDRHDPDARAVTLMTLHNAKGLEYPSVFIAGLEHGLFPLARTLDEPDGLEEERRLFYVGITRARRKLYLLHARMRRRAGEVLPGIPSAFLEAVPDELVTWQRTPAVVAARQQGSANWAGGRRGGGWGGRRDSFGAGSGGGFGAGAGGGGGDTGGSGLTVDYDHAQDAPRFVKGERVLHAQFGRGTIRELSGFGQDLKAVIEFDGAGRKKVVLRYANLQKEL